MLAMDDMARQVDQALVVKPGDILVLRYEQPLSCRDVDIIAAATREQLPESIRVLIIDRCAQMAVIRS